MSECGFVRVFGNGTVRLFERLMVKKGLGNGWGGVLEVGFMYSMLFAWEKGKERNASLRLLEQVMDLGCNEI